MTTQGLIILLSLTRACRAQAQEGFSGPLPEGNRYYDDDYYDQGNKVLEEINPIDQWQKRFDEAQDYAFDNNQMQKGTLNQVEMEKCIEKAKQEHSDAIKAANNTKIRNFRQTVQNLQISNCGRYLNPQQN